MAYAASRRKKVTLGAAHWVKILRLLRDQIDDLAIEIDNISRIVVKFADKALLFSSEWNKYKANTDELKKIQKDTVFAGVDSSITPPVRLGPYLISAVSAAAIITKGVTENPVKILSSSIARAPELASAENAYYELKMEMFKLEVKIMEECMSKIMEMYEDNGEKIVFMDGPLVDPPTFPRRDQKLRESYENEYIKRRAETILDGIKNNILTLGMVKKIEGNSLVSNLCSVDGAERDVLQKLNDYTLATLIFKSQYISSFLRGLAKSEHEEVILATKPYELPYNTDYSVYKKYGLHIYSFYILPRLKDPRKRVLRVEIPFDHEPSDAELKTCAWKSAKYIAAAALPGHSVPTPVILAHKACTIPRSAARKVVKEATSRFLTASLSRRPSLEARDAIDLAKGLVE
jgi:hypothetical protein